jgi:hypothetical protein
VVIAICSERMKARGGDDKSTNVHLELAEEVKKKKDIVPLRLLYQGGSDQAISRYKELLVVFWKLPDCRFS